MESSGAEDAELRDQILAGREKEADARLAARGFKLRYSTAILAQRSDECRPCPVAVAYADALPPNAVKSLQKLLRIDGDYFTSHRYGQVGYFSYAHDLKNPDGTLVEQIAERVRQTLLPDFPDLAACTKIEWWAHSREHHRGHQLHFDSDAEGVGGLRHPIASCVIYLSEGIGGSTVITEQKLGDSIASHGWMVPPRQTGLIGAFQGNVLHGVVGGAGSPSDPKARRTTLMIAFWKDIKLRPSISQTPGPCRPLPYGPKWVKQITKRIDMPETQPKKLSLDYVEPFFHRIGSSADDAMPEYEEIWQGL